jgi:hypothetical protein
MTSGMFQVAPATIDEPVEEEEQQPETINEQAKSTKYKIYLLLIMYYIFIYLFCILNSLKKIFLFNFLN